VLFIVVQKHFYVTDVKKVFGTKKRKLLSDFFLSFLHQLFAISSSSSQHSAQAAKIKMSKKKKKKNVHS
jgi:hypothetical protein